MEEIEKHAPGLIDRLATHPGVGWVMVRSAADGPVVLGGAGGGCSTATWSTATTRSRASARGPRTTCAGTTALAHTPDILVNSLYDPETGEVAAFEELVGCHGGLGGWQDRPVLIHPREWTITGTPESSDAVHAILKSWLDLIRTG
jgi:hypothetical protein